MDEKHKGGGVAEWFRSHRIRNREMPGSKSGFGWYIFLPSVIDHWVVDWAHSPPDKTKNQGFACYRQESMQLKTTATTTTTNVALGKFPGRSTSIRN